MCVVFMMLYTRYMHLEVDVSMIRLFPRNTYFSAFENAGLNATSIVETPVMFIGCLIINVCCLGGMM